MLTCTIICELKQHHVHCICYSAQESNGPGPTPARVDSGILTVAPSSHSAAMDALSSIDHVQQVEGAIHRE